MKNTTKIQKLQDEIEANYDDNVDKVYIVDSWNNHKVVHYCESEKAAMDWVASKEYTENWENTVETFEEYSEGFYTVSLVRMYNAVREYGQRKLQYWT